MTFTCFTRHVTSLLNTSDNPVRWAIFTVGMAVNGAILFYPTANPFVATHFDHSSIYQPIAAANNPQPIAIQVSQYGSAQFDQANLLAVTGNRDAATDLYIQAMSDRVVEQSQH